MKIYVNGDSYAWGAELENPEQDRFSRLISNQFECEEINQSICGNSNHVIFATTKKWIENNDTIDTYFIIVLTDFQRGDSRKQLHFPESSLINFGKELLIMQDYFKKYNLNYFFIDGFSSYFSLIIKDEHIRIQQGPANIKDEIIPLYNLDGYDKDTIKTFKDCLTQIENVLYIEDKLSILELIRNLNDYMPDGHPGKKTHKRIADYIIKKIHSNEQY
jgi:hypothetical protein